MSWRDWLGGPKPQIADTKSVEPSSAGANRHLKNYLEHYLNVDGAPGFAVLVTGLWGSGKTFQIRRVLDLLISREGYVFVSLNGVAQRRELDDAVFAAVYPWTQNKGVQVGTALGKALLKHAKIDLPELNSGQLTLRSTSGTYVFDDFERCRLPRAETLGYINEFVERDGRKVIIIADESKLLTDQEYLDGKEKVVGKTLEVEADFDAAFDHFLKLIDNNDAGAIFKDRKIEIERIYIQSGLKNLRILQQTMGDFERLIAVLEIQHLQNKLAVTHLLNMFFALSFELRSGRIKEADLRDRVNKIVAGMMGEKKPTPMSTANDRYAGIELSENILPDEVLIDVLIRGRIEQSQIREAVNSSSWFVGADEPSWRAVWHSYERDDGETEAAVATMLNDFKDRKFEKSGEVLHLFGQMLWLAEIRASGLTSKETVMQCRTYVDDLRKTGRLEPILRRFPDNIDFGAYGGLVFAQNETKEFKALADYFSEQRRIAEVQSFPVEAERLTELAIANPTEFKREIAFGHESNATFAEVPVFAHIDAKELANKLIRLPPWHLREIMLGFSLRYEMGALTHRLAEERAWAEDFEAQLKVAARKLNRFGQDRVKRLVTWTIGQELGKLR